MPVEFLFLFCMRAVSLQPYSEFILFMEIHFYSTLLYLLLLLVARRDSSQDQSISRFEAEKTTIEASVARNTTEKHEKVRNLYIPLPTCIEEIERKNLHPT